jgi:hypothetical protein
MKRLIVLSIAVLAVAGILGACNGGVNDADYVSSHQTDFNTVTNGIANIQTEIGLIASGSTAVDVNQLATDAQQLHDTLGTIHTDMASFDSSDGATLAFTASGELRDAMDALVNYTGDPNPKSLAGFTTQYQTAVGDWNAALTALWSSAKKQSTPPTIATP